MNTLPPEITYKIAKYLAVEDAPNVLFLADFKNYKKLLHTHFDAYFTNGNYTCYCNKCMCKFILEHRTILKCKFIHVCMECGSLMCSNCQSYCSFCDGTLCSSCYDSFCYNHDLHGCYIPPGITYQN